MNDLFLRENNLSDILNLNDVFDGFDEQSPNKIVTSSALIIIDGDIVSTYTNPDSEFSGQDADKNVESIWPLIEGKKIFHLIIPDPSTHVTVEARDYANPKFDSVKKAEAIVIKTLGHRLLAQFYLKARHGKSYPVRIFDSEIDAHNWFRSLP